MVRQLNFLLIKSCFQQYVVRWSRVTGALAFMIHILSKDFFFCLLSNLFCLDVLLSEVTAGFTDASLSYLIFQMDLIILEIFTSKSFDFILQDHFSNASCYILTNTTISLITDSKLGFTTCSLFQGHDCFNGNAAENHTGGMWTRLSKC